jgi:hypothetical protein
LFDRIQTADAEIDDVGELREVEGYGRSAPVGTGDGDVEGARGSGLDSCTLARFVADAYEVTGRGFDTRACDGAGAL